MECHGGRLGTKLGVVADCEEGHEGNEELCLKLFLVVREAVKENEGLSPSAVGDGEGRHE